MKAFLIFLSHTHFRSESAHNSADALPNTSNALWIVFFMQDSKDHTKSCLNYHENTNCNISVTITAKWTCACKFQTALAFVINDGKVVNLITNTLEVQSGTLLAKNHLKGSDKSHSKALPCTFHGFLKHQTEIVHA